MLPSPQSGPLHCRPVKTSTSIPIFRSAPIFSSNLKKLALRSFDFAPARGPLKLMSFGRRLGLLIVLVLSFTLVNGLINLEEAYAQASPGCGSGTCVSTGTRLTEINSSDSTLLNATLGSMLGTNVNLSLADWQALADADITLQDLQTQLSAGTPAALLSKPISLGQLLDALNQVEGVSDLPAIDNLLNNLEGTPAKNATLNLGDLIQLGSGAGTDTNATINVLDLVTGAIQLFNYQNLATTPTPITVSASALGLDQVGDITIQAQVIEPPVLACGPAGTDFYSAGVRVKLGIEGLDLALQGSPVGFAGVGASVQLHNLDVYLDVASGTGIIQSIDAIHHAVTVQATPGVTDIYVGTIADDLFFTHDPINLASLTPGIVGSLTITLPAVLALPATVLNVSDVAIKTYAQGTSGPRTLKFTGDPAGSGHYPQTLTASTSASAVTSYTTDLITHLEIDANLQTAVDASLGTVNGGIVGALLPLLQLGDIGDLTTPIVDVVKQTLLPNLLGPLFNDTLNEVVDPLLNGLGIGLGQMDVTVLGVGELCPALAVTKSHVGNLAAGSDGQYTILVTNTGSYTTQFAITVSDILPSGLSYASHTDASWVRQGNRTTFVNNTKVGPGQSLPPLHLTVHVAADAPGVVFNKASATTTGNSGGSQSLATDRTVITGSSDGDGDGSPNDPGQDPDDNNPCIPNNTASACDRDGDGLTNSEEDFHQTDPDNPDTDGDGAGLNDGQEVNGNPPSDPLDACDPNPNAAACDRDGDGLNNTQEGVHHTDPDNPDTDGDTANDGNEVTNGSDPLNPCSPNPNAAACDRDNDDLDNGSEVVHNTDPDNPDTDGDTIKDGAEVNNGSDPTDACDPNPNAAACDPGASDTDGDHTPDGQDTAPTDPCNPNPNAVACDSDHDGLDHNQEGSHNTDPNNPDTDSDTVNDGDEVDNGSDPLNPCSPDDHAAACDRDHDGLTNGEEQIGLTDPDNPDTDGDGILDGDDPAPLNPCSPVANAASCPSGTGDSGVQLFVPTIKVGD